jgi:putative addiction module component (TIGR02574 family)
MKTAEIRNRLHHFIDTAEDKKVKAIYTLFEDKIGEEENEEYTPEFKAELERRYEEYKADGKVISREEMDKRIKRVLGKAK